MFWTFMLFLCLLIPALMIGFGALFRRRAPKEINYLFGYRTARSMKNEDTWCFAHGYIGRLWLIIGCVMLPLSIVPLLFCIDSDKDVIGTYGLGIMFIQLILLITPIFFTERALRRTFDENGTRKDS